MRLSTNVVAILLSCILGTGTFIIYKQMFVPPSSFQYTIGIIQTASHPALDAARDGFIQTLEQEMPNQVSCIIRNAQGSATALHTIAQRFHASSTIDGIFAIATPAAQAIAAVEKEKPIFIAAVSDPYNLGIMEPQTNVCGSSDMVDGMQVVALLTALCPQANKVALLFNSAETNSHHQVVMLKKALHQAGCTILEFGCITEIEIPIAITSACQKADAIILPNDNLISSSISLIATIALQYKKPVIASDLLLVCKGILAAYGVDYMLCGSQAAKSAIAVLTQHQSPGNLSIQQQKNESMIHINKSILQELHLIIPKNVSATIIE
jgi:putative tryptophan/tyrosine transport system substrate-binding protein